MKSNTILTCMVAALVAGIPAVGLAQRGGFQAGIAQSQFVTPAPQTPAFGVNGVFRGVPAMIAAVPQVVAPVQVPVVPNFPTVIVSNQVLVPGQTMFSPPVANTFPGGFTPATPVQAATPFLPVARHPVPVVGTSRADVVRQFGQPSVTVITSGGETLYFPGGATIVIQNGRVAGPR
jgi:hypothetical protein